MQSNDRRVDPPRMDRDLAAALAERIVPVKKECWRNSVLAVSSYRGDADAFYVEGLLYLHDLGWTIDHGWAEIGGAIVDVTLTDEPAENYHEVFRYAAATLPKLVGRRATLPFFANSHAGRKKMLAALDHFFKVVLDG